MKILVCITNVPDTTSKISFLENNTKFDETGIQFIIGPYDDYALAKAVDLKASHGATVTVLNVGEASSDPTIRKALAIGADDAIRVNAKPVDSWFVAQQIAEVARQGNYDLIMMGRESIDYNSGIVHGMVGGLLDIPSVSPVMQLEVVGETAKIAREIEGGKEFLEAKLPAVLGCQEPISEWKIPNMRGIMTARSKPLNVVEPVGQSVTTESISYENLPEKGAVKLVDADNPSELIDLLKNEAKVL